MSDYNSNDLKSVLVYIKDKFGLDVYIKQGRVPALLSDLAPNLESERRMLERMSRLGMLKEFFTNINADEGIKKRLISKIMFQLIYSEYIRPSVAAAYLRILTIVFEWDIDIEIPEEFSIEKMRFDGERYMQEAQTGDFLMGQKAFNAEKFDEARSLFGRAYERRNILAGVCLGEIYYLGKGFKRDFDIAIPLFMEGMNNGCPLGAAWLADAYRTGKGVPQDRRKATDLFDSYKDALEAMCVCGSTGAQYFYGFYLLYGFLCNEDKEKALYWLEKAMKAGHIGAGTQIAKIYLYGWGCEQDTQKAINILENYSETTNVSAHYELGKIYNDGKYCEPDYKKALELLLFAAEHGVPAAQTLVGNIYYYGHGIDKDLQKAYEWYSKSADNGDVDACGQLGAIYLSKTTNTKSDNEYDELVKKAMHYYIIAANAGNASAQYNVGKLYLQEYKKYRLAKRYLEMSAVQNNCLAQKELAHLYLGNYGYNNISKYVYWIKCAAEHGDAESQRILGETYIQPLFPNDNSEAVKWLTRAAKQKDIQAIAILAKIYATVEEYKDIDKTRSYLTRAEQLLTEAESEGRVLINEHKKIADIYYEVFTDKSNRQVAFDHYCRVLSFGQRDVVYDLGWMYFINGYQSSFLNLNTEELMAIIKEEEEKSKSSNLAYLLGLIYYGGRIVPESKAEAEKWYLKSIEKGSVSARCKLAQYYIKEQYQYVKGFKLIEQAYRFGSLEGTRLLGLCYRDGIGVKRNRRMAKALLREAADKGDTGAIEELKMFIF